MSRSASMRHVPTQAERLVRPVPLPATPDERADMQACAVCGRRDTRRMHALMTLWYGHFAGVPLDHGYFYLCPPCFSFYIPAPATSHADATEPSAEVNGSTPA